MSLFSCPVSVRFRLLHKTPPFISFAFRFYVNRIRTSRNDFVSALKVQRARFSDAKSGRSKRRPYKNPSGCIQCASTDYGQISFPRNLPINLKKEARGYLLLKRDLIVIGRSMLIGLTDAKERASGKNRMRVKKQGLPKEALKTSYQHVTMTTGAAASWR